jgi:Tfp pilus assembly protein PilV
MTHLKADHLTAGKGLSRDSANYWVSAHSFVHGAFKLPADWVGLGEVAHQQRSTGVRSVLGLVDVRTTGLHLRLPAADFQGVMPGISRRQNLSLLDRGRDEMPSISRRPNLSALQRARDEAGFALIEVMVSAVLLIVLALATLSVIDRAQATSSISRSRVVAAQLAQSEQDMIRQMPISALAGGYHPNPPVADKPVGGITYKVASEADWVTDSGGAVTCSTTGRVAYLQSTSTVTWPGMGNTKPVVADAIVDPGVAALGANKGALTVLLSKADGTGTQGINVTAGGVSSVTDENGCAVLANLDAGPQTLSYNTAGYVDKDAKQAVSKAVTIGAGTIAQATGSYDVAGRINTTIVDDSTPTPQVADWPQPMATPPVTTVAMDHAQRSTPTLFTTPIDSTLSNASAVVFPFASSYKAYVGNCAGNDPSNTLYTNAGAAPGAQVNPGQTKSVTLTMRKVTVDFGTSSAATGTTLRVSPDTAAPSMTPSAPSAPCTGIFTVSAPASGSTPAIGPQPDANGKITFPLPYGVWRVCATKFVGSPTNLWFQTKSTAWSASTNLGTESPTVTTATTTGNYTADLATALTYPSGTVGAPSTSTCP